VNEPFSTANAKVLEKGKAEDRIVTHILDFSSKVFLLEEFISYVIFYIRINY